MNDNAPKVDYQALLKRASDTIEALEKRLARVQEARCEPIAIIGMGMRLPGDANDAASFWRLLSEGVDAVTEVPPDRWDVDAYYDPNPDTPGKTTTRWGAFLKNVDEFDPRFFGISPREAAAMDPQQRLLLEVSWEALENAGHASALLVGSATGVFVGMVASDYSVLPRGDFTVMDGHYGTGSARSIAAGRISYTFGIHGPAVCVDTACSSSAVATHLACLSLRAGECDMALAGGVNLTLVPDGSISASRGRMMSPTGRCRTFDTSADGYVRGEGCAILVLRRLSDAVAAGDNVLAVIVGTAINQDGRSNGLTAPNGKAQETLVRAALADAGLEPGDVGYIEAHGTGTTLGDPVEVRALGTVYAASRTSEHPLMLGSVKTNIGHLEAVAGTAGLVKLVLALQRKTIPPHLHLQRPNPHIPWDALPISVPTGITPWRAGDGGRLVGAVSSFGFSGTNSHIIVAEAPPAPEPQAERRASHLVTLSGRTPAALTELAERYQRHLAGSPETRLADVAFTANTGRTHEPERLAVLATSAADLAEKLAAWTAGDASVVLRGRHAAAPEVAFLFTGQGSQYVGMGRRLYETEPAFRAAMDRCDELLRPHLERSLLAVIRGEDGSRLIDQTAYTQPALFALEYALAQLWRSWGIEPGVMLGHSVGEYVAACVAGVLTLQDALRLIAARGRLMQALPAGGAMAAVFADEAAVAEALAPHEHEVAIAAVNGPDNVVISGAQEAVQAVVAAFASKGVKAQPLTVSHAFHSPLMEPMLDAFSEVAASIRFSPPSIGIISNVTGKVTGAEIATPAYWREHVRAPVRFADGLRTLHESGCTAFLELGPGPTLLGMGRRCLPDAADALWVPSLRPGRDDVLQMLESLGALYVHGADIDWAAVEQDGGGRRIPMPTYPFQRQRYWLDLPKDGARRASGPALHPLVQERLRSPHLSGTVFQSTLRVDAPAYLNDHRIYGVPLFPATGFVEMAWVAARQVLDGPLALEQVQLREALALPEPGERTVQVAIAAASDGASSFEISSLNAEDGDDWTLHASGRIRRLDATATAEAGALDELRAGCSEEVAVDQYYERLAAVGAEYGPVFRGLRHIQRRDGEALARIELPEGAASQAGTYQLHPALLDAGIQLLGAARPNAASLDETSDVFVPVDLGSYTLHQPGRAAVWCQARVQADPGDGDVLKGELRLRDADGSMVAEVAGVHLRRVSAALIQQVQRAASDPRLSEWLYKLDWQPAPAPEPRPEPLAGRWLILADDGGVGARLAERIEAEVGTCALLRPADIDPLDRDGMAHALRAASGDDPGGLHGVVHLWSLDAPDRPDPDALDDHQRMICGSVLSLVQAAASAGIAVRRLRLVTRGAQWTAGHQAQVSPVQSALWGLANAIRLEHAELSCVGIDLDPSIASDAVATILAELGGEDLEDRIAWRAGQRFVARLARYAEPRAAARVPAGPVELDISERGMLDNLVLRPATRRPPGPGEVEIRVGAVGLNFRDVLNALGMYPGPAGPIGNECAGTVVAVGEGVSNVAVGDEVIALGAGTFRSYLITKAHSVHPKPAGMSFAEAATIPITFLTAYYGLHTLAGIKPGDRVLIHAAAGGVGLAAVQLALNAGAEVFGTAGSPHKRAFLESLGVRHVSSSRTLDFADEIMAITEGRGVDIVLNALADDFIPRSLSVLADGGCFLEIGKRGIWTPEQVAALNPTLRHHPFDLADVLVPNPGFLAEAFAQLLPLFESAALRPLPLQVFPLAEVAEAFRFMAQAKHTGKIVVIPERAGRSEGALVHEDGTYLITGGLGGLGLTVARWLVERGARTLVLTGRSAPSPAALETVTQLEGEGARVVVFRGDVAAAADVERLLALVAREMPPLRGIIHAAGVLDDGVLLQQSWPRFQTVMRPKVQGAWNLHVQTSGLPLDFFVLFSTGSALMGSAGQGNYAAANAFLDGLAHHRRSLGLAATTINWGPWSDVGMAAGVGSRDQERWKEAGLGMIAPAEGVRALERLLTEEAAQAAVLPFDWARFLHQDGARPPAPFFARMVAAPPTRSTAATARTEPGFLDQLRAKDPGQRLALLQEHVRDRVIRVLALSPSTQLDASQHLLDLGMDSLMAVELSNHLQSSLGVQLPSTLGFEYPTLGELTEFLASTVLPAAGPTSNGSANGSGAAAEIPELAAVDALAGLSDEEVEAALRRELEARSG